ncbi:MAG: bifunctional UDP-N-acetylmuramoyl-tripeptide:D-alanyl-D-alanine ligase/alanine racemase [Flavobacteriales bacterium]|nr:bifunctional UDP-N-acetylmuramoyl-tripeptide:D-alanyl-D-alanine ligase/alanine racemase [Flavobacteriales bacterium]
MVSRFSLNELLALNGQSDLSENVYFSDFQFDSRNIVQGENSIFFCFESNREKAIAYINQAYERNVRIFVTSFEYSLPNSIFIRVEKPIQLLQKFAKFHLNKFHSIKKIGITGSNGKTIVKEWIYSALKDDYRIVRSPKSYNSQIGLPISVLETNNTHQMGIFECGISKPNEMLNLEDILQPEIGILTMIGDAHQENFKDEKELISEKIILFKNSKIIIYNSDNKLVKQEIESRYKTKKLISFGKNSDAEIQLISCVNKKLEVKIHSEIVIFDVKYQDEASVNNYLTVIALLSELNLSMDKIRSKISNLEAVEMRLEIKQGIYNSVLLNDTFNADLQSLKIALEKLQNQNNAKKMVFITDIYENTKDKEYLYTEVFNLLNKYNLHSVICIGSSILSYSHLSKNKIEEYFSTEDAIKGFDVKNIENSAVLFKGSRKFQLEKLVKLFEKQSHDTILEVDLQSIVHNLKVFKSQLDETTKVMVMVKANSYGTGSYEISEVLQHHKVDYLGVAYADEGAKLREQGIFLPIMVMNPEQNSYETIIEYNLEPEIYSFRVLELFLKKLREKTITKAYPIHLKIDTGMHRLGFSENEVERLVHQLKNDSNVFVKSIFTHLASTDENDQVFTKYQLNAFDKAYQTITKELNYFPIKHALNSHGIINFSDYQYDMVRLGIGIYGFVSDDRIQQKLENVVTLKTKISQIKSILEKESVGYNRRFIADKQIKIATLPIGYADGISRKLGNGRFSVLIKGKKAETVGSVCMDMMMVNVSEIECEEGDEVIVYNEKNSIKEVADLCETIPYEILTSISSRVKRIFLKES